MGHYPLSLSARSPYCPVSEHGGVGHWLVRTRGDIIADYGDDNRPPRILICRARPNRKSASGYFSQSARAARLAKPGSKVPPSHVSAAWQPENSSTKAEVALTRRLKRCKSAQQMLTTLRQSMVPQGQVTLHTYHLGTVFTRLPTLPDDNEEKLRVVSEVESALEEAIHTNFPDPIQRGIINTKSAANVAWGMVKLGLGDSEECTQVLGILEKNMEQCNDTGLSIAMSCFAATGFADREGWSVTRLESVIQAKLMMANEQNVCRFLYTCGDLGVVNDDLKLALGRRLLEIASHPQPMTNAIFALCRQNVDAEELVVQMVTKYASLDSEDEIPQDISMIFAGMWERGWSMKKQVAVCLVERYLAIGEKYEAKSHISLLRGIERHGVMSSDVDVSPIVQELTRKCPQRLHPLLSEVVSSLKRMEYQDQKPLLKLQKLASTSSQDY